MGEQSVEELDYENDDVVILRPCDAIITYKTADGKESDVPTDFEEEQEDGTFKTKPFDHYGTSPSDVKTTIACIKQSDVIKGLVIDAGISNPLPLPNIPSAPLSALVSLMERYVKNPPDKKKHNVENGIQTHTELSEDDKQWLEGRNIQEVIDLIKCTDYIHFKEALSVLEQHMAEEIRTLFNIKDDQTKEQKEQIAAENEILTKGAP